MSEIRLTRQAPVTITREEAMIARRVLFGIIDGLDETDKQHWRSFIGLMFKLPPGECAIVDVMVQRVPEFHRLHMKFESTIFEAQECFDDFDAGFRPWLKVGSGFVTWQGVEGNLVAVPNSLSYAHVEEVAMRTFHKNAVAFLRTDRAKSKLWPHLSDRAQDEMVENILRRYRE